MNLMASFSLFLRHSPFIGESHYQALHFANAAVHSRHSIQRIFFYQDAVLVAAINQTLPQGQISLCQQWQNLAREHSLPLMVCIANALRRGIVDSTEQQRYELPAPTLSDGFELAGLGEMAQALNDSDRVIQF